MTVHDLSENGSAFCGPDAAGGAPQAQPASAAETPGRPGRSGAAGLSAAILNRLSLRAWPYGQNTPYMGGRRDATAHELRQEPDVVLQELASGGLGATFTTRRLARAELDYRRLRA